MNDLTARDMVVRALLDVAPETDPAAVAPDESLPEALDLDSMSMLTYVTAVAAEAGIDVPDRDVPRFATLGGAIAYLSEHA